MLARVIGGVCDADTQACSVEHGDIVSRIADADDLVEANAQNLGKLCQTSCFGYALGHELHVSIGGERDGRSEVFGKITHRSPQFTQRIKVIAHVEHLDDGLCLEEGKIRVTLTGLIANRRIASQEIALRGWRVKDVVGAVVKANVDAQSQLRPRR